MSPRARTDVYEASPDGTMRLAGHDVRDLIRDHGSPLVVLQEQMIRERCRAYRAALASYPSARVHYAAKAFLTTGLCHLIAEEGLGLDVASAGELCTALAAGFPAEQLLVHGSAKTEEDLVLALRAGAGRVVIDNSDEIERLARLASELDVTAQVLLRVTPGIRPSTHRAIQTGQAESKFGFDLRSGAAEQAARRLTATARLELVGLHCHIGSQIFALAPVARAARAMTALYARLKQETGAPLRELDLGGGLAAPYLPEDQPPSIDDYVGTVTSAVLRMSRKLGIDPPTLLLEPGRSIVARAGVTLYTVQSTKRVGSALGFASVDGGMTDNPRHALYGARHHVVAATLLDEPCTTPWIIAGRSCESGDILSSRAMLPAIGQGDILAVLSTGAYTYSMASNYNRLPRPAVVLVGPARTDLLAARETIEDLLRLDRVPGWLDPVSRNRT